MADKDTANSLLGIGIAQNTIASAISSIVRDLQAQIKDLQGQVKELQERLEGDNK